MLSKERITEIAQRYDPGAELVRDTYHQGRALASRLRAEDFMMTAVRDSNCSLEGIRVFPRFCEEPPVISEGMEPALFEAAKEDVKAKYDGIRRGIFLKREQLEDESELVRAIETCLAAEKDFHCTCIERNGLTAYYLRRIARRYDSNTDSDSCKAGEYTKLTIKASQFILAAKCEGYLVRELTASPHFKPIRAIDSELGLLSSAVLERARETVENADDNTTILLSGKQLHNARTLTKAIRACTENYSKFRRAYAGEAEKADVFLREAMQKYKESARKS